MLSKIKAERGIYAVTALQATAVLLTVFGFLPKETMFFSTVLIGLYFLTLPPFLAFKFFVLLLPWFVAVPFGESYRFQSWRIFIVEIFLLILYKAKLDFKFSKIDYSFFAFLAAGLLASDFWDISLRYVVWLLNIYLVFVVSRILVKNEVAKLELIKTASFSVLTIVAVGFVQLLAYLFTPQLVFWQYWASTFVPVLYGSELASVVDHFNSWFAYFKDGAPGLRMFSLLPGSHYFALVGTLGLAFVLRARELAGNSRAWTWAAGLLIFSLVLSSVRGVWVGAIAPVVVIFVLFIFKRFSRQDLKKAFAPFAIFAVLFLASPILNTLLVKISPHNQGIGSLYTRASSSFDPYETSNNLRLELWKISWESVKKHPVFGLGFGNFSLVFGNPENKDLASLANENDPIVGIPKKHVSAHNIFLQVLVETGIVGFAAFLAFLYFVFRFLWSHFKQNQSTWALFVAISLIWVLGQEFFDTSFLLNDKTLILFWLALSLF